LHSVTGLIPDDTLKGRVQCFSIQVVKNKCFLLSPEKQFGAESYCRFRDKRTYYSEKWRHRSKG